ncbi:MFS transporter [Paenibacillus sp. FSL R5-0527]|uniref:Major Facilitator Superfamily protein n=1 Tax=Paenibacillus macerans TaxID=44252 RepID=A0A090ZC55_PAEMA|nr:MFS transporter [Paenibacillus macerans]KFN07800.1 major Facilitator Superfamily protein [Paenibacillus macerans]MBS5910743.1 MFS transporter [Paenibacillus macerans]MCY7560746.1 MFS transporter [Paenibacillus macerans]SUD25871.1 major facilitator superfamily protein [Paenibacillus macerans]GBK65141.1 MFS transporter [Paenibacillus macerans]
MHKTTTVSGGQTAGGRAAGGQSVGGQAAGGQTAGGTTAGNTSTGDISAEGQAAGARSASAGLLVAAVLLTAATLRSPITGVGAMIGQIEAATGLSHALSGMLTTLPLIAFAVFALAAPKLSVWWGMERTLFYSMMLMTAGVIIRSLPSVAALFAGTALIGVGIAVCNVLLPALIKRSFQQRVGLMTSLYTSSLNLWAAISSGISVPLAATALGWRGALGIWALLAAVSALVWVPLLRRRPVASGEAKAQLSPAAASAPARRGGIWRSKTAWLVTIFMGSQSIMFYVSVSWLPDILQVKGMSPEKAGWMLSLMQIVSMGGSFLMPLIAARTDNQKLLTAASSALFFIGFGGIWLGPAALAPLFIVLLGIASGTTFSLVIVFFSLRSRTAEQAGQLSGMAQSVGYLVAAFGPALFGYIHDVSGGWNAPLAAIIAFSVLTALFGYAAGRKGFVDTR